MEENVKDSISPNVRKCVYWAFFVTALAIGSVQTFVAATGGVQPVWITGALAVVAYASGALGLQAAVYTPRTPVAAVLPVDEGVATIEPVESEEFSVSVGKRFADANALVVEDAIADDVPSSLR